jgi:hypothetical protein
VRPVFQARLPEAARDQPLAIAAGRQDAAGMDLDALALAVAPAQHPPVGQRQHQRVLQPMRRDDMRPGRDGNDMLAQRDGFGDGVHGQRFSFSRVFRKPLSFRGGAKAPNPEPTTDTTLQPAKDGLARSWVPGSRLRRAPE